MSENVIRVIIEQGKAQTGQNSIAQMTSKQINSQMKMLADKLSKSVPSQSKTSNDRVHNVATRASLDVAKSYGRVLNQSVSDFSKSIKEINQSIKKFSTQINKATPTAKTVEEKAEDNETKKKKSKSIRGKYFAASIPLINALSRTGQAYNNMQQVEAGNDLTDPVGLSRQRTQAKYDFQKAVTGTIGSAIGLIIGGLASRSPYGAIAGSVIGEKSTTFGYDMLFGTDNARKQMLIGATQTYTDKLRGNSADQQIGSLLDTIYRTKNHPYANFVNELSAMGSHGQYSQLSNKELGSIAKLSKNNADPRALADAFAQLKPKVKDLGKVIDIVGKNYANTGGNLLSQTKVAVDLVNKAGLQPNDAIKKAFTQNLFGESYASAQNSYLSQNAGKRLGVQAFGQLLGVNTEALFNGDQSTIDKFNSLQGARNNRVSKGKITAQDILQDTFTDALGLNRGELKRGEAGTANLNSDAMSPAERENIEILKNFHVKSIKTMEDLDKTIKQQNVILNNLSKIISIMR